MGQIVKVKVRPGGSVQFPGICANCSQPATERMELRRRSGRRTRFIDVPVCSDCFRELGKESGEEERLRRLARVLAVAVFALVATLVFAFFYRLIPLLAAFIVAMALAALVATALNIFLRRRRIKAARPEKKAILASTGLVGFSWRATTFEFENEEFSERFTELNRERLMEI